MFESTATGSSNLHVRVGFTIVSVALFLTALPLHAGPEWTAGVRFVVAM